MPQIYNATVLASCYFKKLFKLDLQDLFIVMNAASFFVGATLLCILLLFTFQMRPDVHQAHVRERFGAVIYSEILKDKNSVKYQFSRRSVKRIR